MPAQKIIVLLSSDPQCSNAQSVAFYMHHAYHDTLQIQIYLFDYLTQSMHRFNPQYNCFTHLGQLNLHTSSSVITQLSTSLKISTPNDQPISQATFNELGRCTQYCDHMTTLDLTKLSDFGGMHLAQGTIASIHDYVIGNHDENTTMCFLIAPNGRNVPARLLTLGQRFWLSDNGSCMYFRTDSGESAEVNHLIMTNHQVMSVMTEVMLCRAIITGGERFVGNCYGAQVMWLSMGGGITTYGIQKDHVPHNATLVIEHQTTEGATFSANISCEDGICLSDAAATPAGTHPAVEIDPNELYEFFGNGEGAMACNTDFHHNYMMMLSKPLHKRRRKANEMHDLFTEKEHLLASPVRRRTRANDPTAQAHIQRLAKHAREPQDFFDDTRRQQRTSKWVGRYTYQQRVYGSQSHLFYHVTAHSASWGNTATINGESTSENPHHEHNKDLLARCMFGSNLGN